MHQTLFYIPSKVAGIPLFGFGLLLAIWALFSLALMAWLAWHRRLNKEVYEYLPLLLAIGGAIWFVLPHICEPQGLPIRSYGTMLLVAVSLATWLAVRRGRTLGLEPDMVLTIVFWMFIPGILGARAFHVIEYWHVAYLKPTAAAPELLPTLKAIINIPHGGLVVYGSLVGGLLGLLAVTHKYKLPRLAIFDMLAPSLMLGLALGRIGCFMNGCCFGGACDLPWAVTFPYGSPPHVHQIQNGQTYLHGLTFPVNQKQPPIIAKVEPGSVAEKAGLHAGQQIASIDWVPIRDVLEAEGMLLHLPSSGKKVIIKTTDSATAHLLAVETPLARSHPVHPTQIYSSINGALICLFLLALSPFCRRDGELFAVFLTVYPITRFLLEIIRTDESAVFQTTMSISQNVSLILLFGVGIFWFIVLRQPKRTGLPPKITPQNNT